MKGRKFNIIFNLSTLILVLIFSVVGVWAATTHTLGVSTTVSFTASQVKGTIYGTITGVATPVNYYKTGTTPHDIVPGEDLPNWTIPATTITTSGALPNDIVFTIVITNTTPGAAMTANIASITCGTNLNVYSVEQKANGAGSFSTVPNSTGYTFTNLTAATGLLTIQITIKVTDPTVNVSSAAISYTLNIGRA